MNNANFLRSPCEVIREINDLFQGDGKKDARVRKLCAEAEEMTKQLSIKLSKSDDNYYRGWWERVADHTQKMIRRKSPNYKFHKL